MNRLLTRTPDPTLGEPTVSFTYTATGKHATTTDASGTTTYSYDALDRLTTKATPEGTLNYTYDAAGNVASIASSNANGASVAYTYDGMNRLSTVVDNRLASGQNTTTYAYDTASNLVTVTYPNGLHSTFTYDSLNRLTAMATPPVSSYNYTLGTTGIKTNATESTGRTQNWTYDGIYRLTNETINLDPLGKNGSVGYGLDPVGNRQSATSTLPGITSSTVSFNPDDWMSIESYDANGNTISTGGRTFAYDSENRLTSMNGSAVSNVYDGFGNRVSETAGGVTTKYLVDDLNPTGYAQVMDEIVGGSVQREYTYGLQRISENQVVSSAWTPSFYGYDGMGSVRQLTNSAGAVTDTYSYDGFGNLLGSTGTTPNNYLYRGEQYDPSLNLYYLRARYYNQATGRFLGRDSKDGKPADPKTMHRYLYVGADPVNWVDPRGHDVEYAGRLSLSLQEAVPFANAINCGISVGILLGEGTLIEDSNKDPVKTGANIAVTAYGCLTVTTDFKGVQVAVDSGINVGACAFALYQAVDEENQLLEEDDAKTVNQAKPAIDLVGGVIGCAVSAFAKAFGGG